MKVKNIRKYLTEEQITERVKAMGEQISKDYGGETVYLICILKDRFSLPVNLLSGSPLR